MQRRWETLAAAALILLGLALRFAKLDFQSFWRDELATIQGALKATSYLDFLIGYFGDGPHGGLAHFVVRVWAELFGTADWTLRAVPATVGTLGVVASYLLARRLFTTSGERLIFVMLYAVSPFLIYYAQEVRMYVFVALFATLSMERFLAWLDAPTAVNALLYALTAAGLYHSHYMSVLVLLGQGTALMWACWRKRLPWQRFFPVGRLVSAQTWVGAWAGVHLFSLALASARFHVMFPGTKTIRDTFWMWAPDAKLTINTLSMFLGYKLPPWGFIPDSWPAANFVGGFVFSAVAGFAIWKIAVSSKNLWVENVTPAMPSAGVSRWGMALATFLFGLGIPWLISYNSKLHIFLPRTVIGVLPALLILLTMLVAVIPEKLRPLGLAFLLMPVFNTLPPYYGTLHKENWRALVDYVDANAQAGDRVIEHNRPFFYYSERGADIQRLSPADVGNVSRVWVVRELWAGDQQTKQELAQLEAAGYKAVSVEKFAGLALALLIK